MIRASKDFARLEHILDAICKATASVKGLTLEQFLANPDKTAAAERYVTIVGEAANMVSDEVRLNIRKCHGAKRPMKDICASFPWPLD